MLCQRSTGLPLHSATLWSLTELRATNLASATIQQALRSLMVFHIILDELGIDLSWRFESGHLLTLAEVEELANKCKPTLKALCPDANSNVFRHPSASSERVAPFSAGIRLRCIRAYLDWLIKERLLRLGPTHPHFESLRAVAEIMLGAIDARTPNDSRRNTLEAREGLAPDVLERLIGVIKPDSPENPWKNAH